MLEYIQIHQMVSLKRPYYYSLECARFKQPSMTFILICAH